VHNLINAGLPARAFFYGRADLPVCPNFNDGKRSDAIVPADSHQQTHNQELPTLN